MPGRLITSPDSVVTPGHHQLMSPEDRPVPAARKNLRGLPEVQNGRSFYGGRSLYGERNEWRDGDLHVKEGNTNVANGADMTSSRRLEERPSHQQANPRTSYQMPSQPPNSAAPHRPQSAMAISSSSSSYNHAKAMYPARPPSSLGVSWGPSPPTSGINMRYNESDLISPMHQRNHSYGSSVTLGEGYSANPYTSEKSDDVYASVARRQDRVQHGDTSLGSDRYSHRPQTQITGTYSATPGAGRGEGGAIRGEGGAVRGEGGAMRHQGLDNPAFVSEDLAGTGGDITTRPPSTNLDLRSAWQRLYGNSLDPGVSNQRPALDDAVSPGKTRTFEDVPQTFNSRQQINHRPSHLGQSHLQHPHIDQPHLQHPHITRSNPNERGHNTPGSSSQNGRFTPRLTSPDVHAGNPLQNGRNGRFTPRLTSSDLHANSSSQNGRFTPRLTSDLHADSSSQNGRFTPRLTSDLHSNSSSQNGRFTPRNLASPDCPAGSSSADHRSATIRESPTGQSSSNPDPTSGSNNSSQLSADSVSTKTLSTFKPPTSIGGSDPTIGPSSKYPDIQMSTRMSTQAPHQAAIHKRNRTVSEDKRADRRQSLSSPNFTSKPNSPRRQNNSTFDVVGVGIKEDTTRPPSRLTPAVLDSDDSFEDDYSLQPHDSIFNYHEGGSEDGTVTPRASSQVTTPSRAPRGTSRRADNSTPVPATSAHPHRTPAAVTSPDFVPKTPDLLRKSPEARANLHTSNNTGLSRIQQTENNTKPHLNRPGQEDWRSADGQHNNKARSRSLDDVRESENDSFLSFDVENTILTVEPSDQSDRGTVRSHKGTNSVRAQLHRLEGMYSHVMKTLDETSHGTRTRRRWSIGSSDTSSMRHHSHHSLHSRASTHRLGGRDVKAIGKRFQRLESHVITLARSVAHLSSELRVQNSLSREMENVKREIQELKSQSSACPVQPGNLVRPNRLMTDFERYQGWVPSLTNPRRVNKLTRFFGQEPPLLEIFLKQLGYEKYLKNFEQEHIGMIELPYMSEDKLQAVGIPLGPRLRILQEAQVYFKQANLDLYFV